MAKFVYRMQNILDIKLKLESQARVDYGIAAQNYAQEEEKLKELMLRRARYDQALQETMEGKLDVRQIRNAKNDVTTIKALVRGQTLQLRKAELALNEARRNLNQLMQERKTQEKLKEKAFEAFKEELKQQEAKEIDELVSYTYNGK